MSIRRLIDGIGAAGAVAIGLLSWMTAPAYSAGPTEAAVARRSEAEPLVLAGPAGWQRRVELLRSATVSHQARPAAWPTLDECWFVPGEPSGTTPKFDCLFASGEVLKVKYGRNPELHAEVAATALLSMLGYGADRVTFSSRLRCHGCPRYPFAAMQTASRMRRVGLPPTPSWRHGYTDFEWVSVERKLEGRAVETPELEGWAWWELRQSRLPKAELDAFYLTAVFLGHWDNKSANQRLVCLDGGCEAALAMIQDVGATFGPSKVNLGAWRAEPIWADRAACRVSMSRLPFSGATFSDVTISEAGRALLASKLAAIPEAEVRRIFAEARFGPFHPGTDDRRDLDAWTEAFAHRVRQITDNTCPGA